jgi:hypothetical protein
VILGAAAGFASTLVLHQLMMLTAKTIPGSKPPMRKDPGEFMAAKLHVPEKFESAAAKSLQLGYGMTSGALYGAIRSRGGSIFLDGALLGIAVWAAGYLGWLPAAKLMPPIIQHAPRQIAVPIVNHIVFGVGVATAFDGLMRV